MRVILNQLQRKKERAWTNQKSTQMMLWIRSLLSLVESSPTVKMVFTYILAVHFLLSAIAQIFLKMDGVWGQFHIPFFALSRPTPNF